MHALPLLAIAAVLAVGWTAGCFIALHAIGSGFLGVGQPRRTCLAIQVLIGLVLLPGAPAVAAWIAAQQGWTVAAWILGILAVVLALAAISWQMYGAAQSRSSK